MKKLLLLDGNSLLYRAYFAGRPLSTREGFPTNALYGLSNMVFSILEKDAPDYIIAAFDTPQPTFRHEAYAEYKAQRKPPEDALVQQMQPARELLSAFGLQVIEKPGFEGDDIIGTIARVASEKGMETHIYTGDLDTLQLVEPSVRVYHTVKGVSEIVMYDNDRIMERYGIGADRMVDFKGLKGDTSDNIPGVPGIGDKTASKLIAEYGSIEGLYQNIDSLKPGKMKDSLVENKSLALLSCSLARIDTRVPLDSDPLAEKYTEPHWGALLELFRKYEFRSLMDRIPAGAEAEEAPGAAAPEPDAAAPAAEEALPEAAGKPAPPERPETVRVDSEGGLRALKEALAGAGRIALLADEELREMSIYAGGRLWELPVSGRTGQGLMVFDEPFAASLEELKPYLEDPELKKTVYSAKQLYKSLIGRRVCLRGADSDLSLAAYLKDSGAFSAIIRDYKKPAPGKRGREDAFVIKRLWQEAFGAEVKGDAFMLQTLLDRYYGALGQEEKELCDRIEIPLSTVLGDMERRGIEADKTALTEMSGRFQQELDLISERIYAAAGETFNIASPRILRDVLFDKMAIPYPKKGGANSTSEEILSPLAAEYPICGDVLRYRELAKLKSTYADALADNIDPSTGRIHTSFNQTLTTTGRLSSSDPNLQNIPVKTEEGREIRKAFVAGAGYTLISADYSQVEFRLFAHITRDPWLIEAFGRGLDFHTAAAATLFGVEQSEVTPDMRRRAKTLNFAILYGMQEFTLAGELGCSVKEAKEFTREYFDRFPLVKKTKEEILDKARQRGWVSTIMGRRRYVPNINGGTRPARLAEERAAVNMPFQGSAADIIKLAMINLHRRLKGTDAELLLQIHDELVVEAPEAKAADIARLVREEMENAYPLLVPLTCEVKLGDNLGDMRPAEMITGRQHI
ncbi:MAG: DNA polymerase I [Abditibacteriota bacterium]|nr:DNA polymerase I [Abditibacteriota bacterium]